MPAKWMVAFTLLFLSNLCFGQKKFKVVAKETGSWMEIYSLIDEQGKLIRELDTSIYTLTWNREQYGYFVIFSMKNQPGWMAIDANENILFEVYNMYIGEPGPDELVEEKIRIVDSSGRIGFANYLGQIIIPPQFEFVTSFHNGKAIIQQSCKLVPVGDHGKEGGCRHFSRVCEMSGYINEKGIVQKIGCYSFQQIEKEINWKLPDEE